MGSRHCVHIGPYMVLGKMPETATTTTKTKINKVNGCSDVNCKSHKKILQGNFCQLCGSPTEEVVWESTNTNTVVVKENPYDLMCTFGKEDLFFNLDELMIPNGKEMSKYMIAAGEDDESFEKEIPNKEEAIGCFERVYDKFLIFLTEKKVPYEVKFGVISYWW